MGVPRSSSRSYLVFGRLYPCRSRASGERQRNWHFARTIAAVRGWRRSYLVFGRL